MKKRWIFLILVVTIIVAVIAIFVFISKKKKIDRDYELLNESEFLFYPLEIDDRFGVINRYGDVVVEPKYDAVEIPNRDRAIFVLATGESFVVFNDKQEQLFKDFSEVSAISGMSSDGERVYNNTVLKYKENGKYGLLNFEGKRVTGAEYENVESLTDKYGEILVKKNGKLGVLNVKGVILVDCKYDFIKGDGFVKDSSYKQGGYIVGITGKAGYAYGYLARNSKEIIKVGQESIYRVTEIESDDAYLVARENGRYALYKGRDNLTDYKYIDMFYNNGTGTFTVQKNKSYGLINLDGKVVIPEQYEELLVVGIFVNASRDGVDFTFDLSGAKVENSEFVSLQRTSTDKYYISINSNYKYGIADLNKNVVVDNKFEFIEEIPTTGLLIATNDDDVTVYNAEITELVSASNAEIKNIGDYIQITTSNESYFLTADGKKVDNKTVYLDNQLFASKSGNKWGFVDLKDNTVVDFIYDEVTEVNEFGFAGVKRDKKWGIIDRNGNVVLEPVYELESVNPVFIGKYYLNNGTAYGF